jgi:hypothetical protein
MIYTTDDQMQIMAPKMKYLDDDEFLNFVKPHFPTIQRIGNNKFTLKNK